MAHSSHDINDFVCIFVAAKHAFDYAIAWIEDVGEGALDYCGSQEKRSVSEVRFGSDPTLGSDSSTQTSQRSLAMILVTTTPSVDGYTITNYQGIVSAKWYPV